MSSIVHVQAFPQAAFLGELGQAGLPAHALGPGMDAFLQHQQQLLQRAGLAPPSAHHASPLPQPQQRPVSCATSVAPLRHEDTSPRHDAPLYGWPVGGPLLALHAVCLAMLEFREPRRWALLFKLCRADARWRPGCDTQSNACEQAVMTMEELEAQLRRKSQQQQQPQQQQQQQQRMPMPGADPSILGSLGQLGPPGQLGQPSQLASPGAVPPQHMQHGPPGFPHPAGPPQRPLDFDKQHLGTARPVHSTAGSQ